MSDYRVMLAQRLAVLQRQLDRVLTERSGVMAQELAIHQPSLKKSLLARLSVLDKQVKAKQLAIDEQTELIAEFDRENARVNPDLLTSSTVKKVK